jgi:hypothetical protein
MCLVTDKSGKLSINTPENYDKASQKHVAADKIFPEEDLSSQERTLNHHTYQVARFLGVGSTQSDVQAKKMRSALKNTMILPPILYCTPKDHKVLKPGEEHLGPPGRPICGAREAPNAQLSMLLAHVINAAVDDLKKTQDTESCSTEDMIAALEQLNNNNDIPEEQQQEQQLIIGSMDVEALYPSLCAVESSLVVYRLILGYAHKMEGTKWIEAARYLALTCNREDIEEK